MKLRTLEEAAYEIELRRRRKIERRDRNTGRLKGKRIEIEWQGKKQCLADWARELDISPQVLSNRYAKGYPPEMILRVGKVSRGEHPESFKGHLKVSIPGALTAIYGLPALRRHALTGGEVWALLGKNLDALRAIQGLCNPKRGAIDSAWGVVRALRLLVGREIDGHALAFTDGRWQFITISSGGLR
jgi:hypothetical protein